MQLMSRWRDTMIGKKASLPAVQAPVVTSDAALHEDNDELVTEVEVGQLLYHPDGYYWQTPDGKQEFGPFESLELALAHMASASEEAAEPGQTLQEAEDEIGVADWIDPDTGPLAEGPSTPRFQQE